MSGDCESCGEHCLDCKCGFRCDPPGTKFELGRFKLPEFLPIPDFPPRCLCVQALDGYETYKLEDNIIGVRPIWFSVKDRLPPENIRVLILCKDGYIEIEKITYPKDNNLWSCISKEDITHWMPLPQPPKD